MAFPESITLGLMDSNQLSIFLEILVFQSLSHREEYSIPEDYWRVGSAKSALQIALQFEFMSTKVYTT